jgi:hypothetical protein
MNETLAAAKGKIDSEECQFDHLVVLTAEECDRTCETILGLREHWTQRRDTLFYTLGVASYMDATQGHFAQYHETSHVLNPLLVRHFGWLYDRLASVFSGYLGEPCIYDPNLSYPGFHVFIGDGKTEAGASASMHYDLQYKNIDWSSYQNVDFSRQLSITLSLRLPEAGSGIYVWNVNDQLLRRLTADERKQHIAANNNPSYHPYKLGEMVVHNGHYLHQIARIRQMQAGEHRITLQGHAVSTEQGWVLYW